MSQPARARSNRGPGIRRLVLLSSLSFGVVIVLIVIAMTWSSTVLHQTMDTVARDTRSEALATELGHGILMYQRLSNLHVLMGDPEDAAEKQAFLLRIRELLARGELYVGGSEEQRLLEQLEANLATYLQARAELDRQGLDPGMLMRRSAPALNVVLDDLETLRDLNDAQVDQAYAEAMRVDRLIKTVGTAALAVLVLGLVVIAAGMRRYLLRPVVALHGAMDRFRAGDLGVRGKVEGAREVGDLASMFNDMGAAMARQREAQLEFLAGVAHDLKNPLNAVKMGIYSLEHEASELRRGRTRALLDQQVSLLSRMIDDLLDSTRIEAGQLELRRLDFDLRELVADIVRLYSPTAPVHRIVAEVPERPVSVHADPARVEQVLSNLLSNAIKYSPMGGHIRIAVAAEGEFAMLEVTDSGVGIPQDEIESVFLPFRRRRSDLAPGAGLGLSVVRRIVEAHGGEIEVSSEVSVGSTFRVRLPRPVREAAARAGGGRGDLAATHIPARPMKAV